MCLTKYFSHCVGLLLLVLTLAALGEIKKKFKLKFSNIFGDISCIWVLVYSSATLRLSERERRNYNHLMKYDTSFRKFTLNSNYSNNDQFFCISSRKFNYDSDSWLHLHFQATNGFVVLCCECKLFCSISAIFVAFNGSSLGSFH